MLIESNRNNIITEKIDTSKGVKSIYDVVRESLLNIEDEVDLSKYSKVNSSETMFKLIAGIINDTPEILYYHGGEYWSNGILKLQYSMEKEITVAHLEELNQRVDEIIAEVIEDGMSEYEKEKAIHDYIIENARYDSESLRNNTVPPESYSAYGVLVLGKGVCESYAKAMKLIMDRLNIETMIITGQANNIDHAWNIIKIEGEYYHVDLTWNDPSMDDGSDALIYDYFNLTDEEMGKDHNWNSEEYPLCTERKYNYYYYNDLIIRSYEELYDKIRDSMLEGKKVLEIKVLDYDENTYNIVTTVNKVVKNHPSDKYTGYSYSVNSSTGVIFINFSYR